MAFCRQCGTKFEDNQRYCPKCGAPAPQQGSGYEPPVVPGSQQKASAAKDAQDNKMMGVLSYLFCLWFIPLIAAKGSKFARFHAGQGLNVFILWVIEIIVYSIVNAVMLAGSPLGALTAVLSGSFLGVSIIFTIVSILIGILELIGIINAVKGEMKELPLVGKMRILK